MVERAHPSYAGALPLARQVQLIRGAAGQAGSNIDYLVNTLAHLGELGIRERALERLLGSRRCAPGARGGGGSRAAGRACADAGVRAAPGAGAPLPAGGRAPLRLSQRA